MAHNYNIYTVIIEYQTYNSFEHLTFIRLTWYQYYY